jgi:hypothetical protein
MYRLVREFQWFVPAHGFVIQIEGRPLAEDRRPQPSEIILRPALSPEDRPGTLGQLAVWAVGGMGAQLEDETARTAFQKLWEWWIGAGDSPDVPGRWETPLRENAALFKTFAAVDPHLDGILAFANKYGNLKGRCTIEEWWKEIEAMRQAASIWEAWSNFNAVVLRRHFLWQTDGNGKRVVLFDSHPGKPSAGPQGERVTMVIGSETSPGGLWQALADKDVRMAAQLYLMRVIDDHLVRLATSTPVWDKEEKRVVRVLMPLNLLGAIWLQFEHFVTGSNKLVSCPVCGRWFEVSRTAGRSDKEYCQPSCRSKAYRDRRAPKKKPKEK